MIYVINDSNNPYFNLALEEYVLTQLDTSETYFLLWQNEPTIVVGKHQNTIEEINSQYVKENKIHVARRLSGGGAVYHDLGNLNFTFIVDHSKEDQFDFKKFTRPVIHALKKMGVEAMFNSRNDLIIDGKKFSGNSQYLKKNRLLHHGTLMFNSNIDELVRSLNVSDDKIVSKGIKSVRSRVTNISDYMHKKINVDEFKRILIQHLQEELGSLKQYHLNEKELKEVDKIMHDRYETWHWNYGESPKFNIKKEKRFEQGKIKVLLDVENGLIKTCKFYGDFFGVGDLKDVENQFINQKYEEQTIKKILENIDVNQYFLGMNKEQLVECIV